MVAIIFIRVNFRQVFIGIRHICIGVAAFLELLRVFFRVIRRSLLPFVQQVLSFFEGIRVFLIIQKLPYQAENTKPEVEFRNCFQYPFSEGDFKCPKIGSMADRRAYHFQRLAFMLFFFFPAK